MPFLQNLIKITDVIWLGLLHLWRTGKPLILETWKSRTSFGVLVMRLLEERSSVFRGVLYSVFRGVLIFYES